MGNKQKSKKKFNIEDIPEAQRLKIFKIIIITLTTIIFSAWLIITIINLSTSEFKNKDNDWEIIKKEISNLTNTSVKKFEQDKNYIKNKWEKLQADIETIQTATTSNNTESDSQVSQEELEIIKEKLLEIQNQDQ